VFADVDELAGPAADVLPITDILPRPGQFAEHQQADLVDRGRVAHLGGLRPHTGQRVRTALQLL